MGQFGSKLSFKRFKIKKSLKIWAPCSYPKPIINGGREEGWRDPQDKCEDVSINGDVR